MKIGKWMFKRGINKASLNPDFIKYVEGIKQQQDHQTGKIPYREYIPPPVNLSYLTGKKIFSHLRGTALPSSFDLRKEGRVTSVKNEGPAGAAWAFAAYGSLESCLLPGHKWNFSENNMKNLLSEECPEGFDRPSNGPGNSHMSTAYLARWSGPVLEKDDPYDPNSPGNCVEMSPRMHLRKVIFIPARNGYTDNSNIKLAIMNYGAVATAIYFDEVYYDNNFSFYCDEWKFSFNHAVCLVGWDDNYDRKKFKNLPPGPGVFIAKNCWGTNWGDKGYFYISYYDQMVGKDNALFSKVMNPNIYNVIYEYDPLGWCDSAGANSTTAWFANMFTSISDQELHAVSWYVASPDSSYNLYIYTNPANSDPRSGKLVKSLSGKVLDPSYYQKAFSTPVKLTNGQKFSVVVEATTPGWDWPVPLQMPIQGYSSKARSEPGQGFLSMDGESWLDVTEVFENASVCLKAFASKSDRSKRGMV